MTQITHATQQYCQAKNWVTGKFCMYKFDKTLFVYRYKALEAAQKFRQATDFQTKRAEYGNFVLAYNAFFKYAYDNFFKSSASVMDEMH